MNFNGIRLCQALFFILFTTTALSAWSASRCQETDYLFWPDRLSCEYRSKTLSVPGSSSRQVLWQLPLGTPPAGGWPVVLIFQGTNFPVEFSRYDNASFGGYHELRTIKALLDNGFAVIAPRAIGNFAWQTNVTGPLISYEATADFRFFNRLFAALNAGDFGPLNTSRKYATGISSGGYNASRMALTWPGEFNALVIHSASWAECLAATCVVPRSLPDDHPPTRFVHGYYDTIVPWWTMDSYYDRLLYEGVVTSRITRFGGHEWFPESPAAVLDWFRRYP